MHGVFWILFKRHFCALGYQTFFLKGIIKGRKNNFLIPLVLLIVIVDNGPNCASIYNILTIRDLSLFSLKIYCFLFQFDLFSWLLFVFNYFLFKILTNHLIKRCLCTHRLFDSIFFSTMITCSCKFTIYVKLHFSVTA